MMIDFEADSIRNSETLTMTNHPFGAAHAVRECRDADSSCLLPAALTEDARADQC